MSGYHAQRGASRDRVANLLMASKVPLTTPQILARTGLSKSVASGLLNALEREGWVERRAVPGDARAAAWAWRKEGGEAVA